MVSLKKITTALIAQSLAGNEYFFVQIGEAFQKVQLPVIISTILSSLGFPKGFADVSAAFADREDKTQTALEYLWTLPAGSYILTDNESGSLTTYQMSRLNGANNAVSRWLFTSGASPKVELWTTAYDSGNTPLLSIDASENQIAWNGSTLVTAADMNKAVTQMPWSDCPMQAYGDSQTEFNSKKANPWPFLLTLRDAVYSPGLFSLPTSGYTLAVNASSYGSILNQMKSSQALFPPLIFVMGGVNDVWFDSPLGTIDSNDNTTVYGALNEMCEYLYTNAPKSTVVFITPTAQDHERCVEPSSTNHTTVLLVRKAIIDVAEKYGLPVFDAYSRLGIYPKIEENANIYTVAKDGSVDKLHLGDAGQSKLADALIDFLRGIPRLDAEMLTFPAKNSYRRQPNIPHCWMFNDTLFAARSQSYSCCVLEGVRELSISRDKYDSLFRLPKKNATEYAALGWFGFRQPDGTWIGVSPSKVNSPASNADYRGDRWTWDETVRNTSNHSYPLWSAPSAIPSTIRVTLENRVGKLYFDDDLMYSVQNTDCIGYIASDYRVEGVRGVTLAMENDEGDESV